MKRLIFCLAGLSLFLFNSCDSEIDPNCIEVKLMTEICGNAVLQVVDDSFNKELGSWTDTDGKEHRNVFSTFLIPCDDNYPDKVGDTFFIALTDSLDTGSCGVCLALPANMPEERYNVRIVEPCAGQAAD